MQWWEAETRILTLLHMSAKVALESGQLAEEEASKFFCSGLCCASAAVQLCAVQVLMLLGEEDLERKLAMITAVLLEGAIH